MLSIIIVFMHLTAIASKDDDIDIDNINIHDILLKWYCSALVPYRVVKSDCIKLKVIISS